MIRPLLCEVVIFYRPPSDDTWAQNECRCYVIGLQVLLWNNFNQSMKTYLPSSISSPSGHSPLTASICSLPASEFTVSSRWFFFCLSFIMQLSRGHYKSIEVFCRTNVLLINRLLRLCFMGSCPGSLASTQGSTTLEERSLAAVTVGLWANLVTF